MNIKTLLTSLQILIAVLLIASILLQSRGTGLSGAFGGGGETFRTRRGVERILFVFTIILSILFVINILLVFAV